MEQLTMRRPNLAELPEMPALPHEYALRGRGDEDLSGIAVVLRIAFGDTRWNPEYSHAVFVQPDNVKKVYVVEHQRRIVAVAAALLASEAGRGMVHYVAACPAHKGLRPGYAVTLAVLVELARLGCSEALLRTDDEGLPAIETYLNLGFIPEVSSEADTDRWSEILMRLKKAQANYIAWRYSGRRLRQRVTGALSRAVKVVTIFRNRPLTAALPPRHA